MTQQPPGGAPYPTPPGPGGPSTPQYPGPAYFPPIGAGADRLAAEQTLASLGYAPAPMPGHPTTPGSPVAGPPPPRRFDWKRIVWLVVIPLVFAACLIGLLVYVGYHIGLTALIVGIVAALIPVPVLVGCFIWLDRYEPEPIRYLVLMLGWGSCIATLGALFANTALADVFAAHDISENWVAVVTAPVTEETLKALGPLILLLATRRRAFSGVVDGIVYCGLSATGFAMVENILYLGGKGYAEGAQHGGAAGGARDLILIFFLRVLLSGFAHPLFTMMTGIGLGIAARTNKPALRFLAPLGGWLLAMTLHGSWNGMTVLAQQVRVVLLYGYFSVMVPIFLGAVGLALWLRSWEGGLTQRMLVPYVQAGWISPPELAALATLGRRQSARLWARRVAGEHGVAAMRGYQFAATQLALLRDGMVRGLDSAPAGRARSAQEERRLLEQLAGYRAVFAGRDPGTPMARWDGSRYHVTFPDGQVRPVEAPVHPVVPVPVIVAGAPVPRWR
jgi:RsiW-degrading membrane proteinase PrsW (M82 family)